MPYDINILIFHFQEKFQKLQILHKNYKLFIANIKKGIFPIKVCTALKNRLTYFPFSFAGIVMKPTVIILRNRHLQHIPKQKYI